MGYLQAFVMLWPFFIHNGVWEVLAMDLKGHMGSVELYFLNRVLPSTVKEVLSYRVSPSGVSEAWSKP